MTEQANPNSGRWRRYLLFSVRGVFLVVLMIGAGLGWLVNSTRIQHDAVAAVQKAGGVVFYERDWLNNSPVSNGNAWGRKWLVDRLGVDYFGPVTKVVVSSPEVSDVVLVHIGRLRRLEDLLLDRQPRIAPPEEADPLRFLRTLYLAYPNSDAALTELLEPSHRPEVASNRPNVTNAGLAHLEGLTNLRKLVLNGTDVTDVGLAHLRRLTKLQLLHLGESGWSCGIRQLRRQIGKFGVFLPDAGVPAKLTDAGLMHLAELTRLTDLDLSGTGVTDAGLVHLRGLTRLTKLHFADTGVTDAGLVHLEGLTSLQKLVLSDSDVEDDGLVHLKGLNSLQRLAIAYCDVTDAGLAHLNGLTGLQYLDLRHTMVTDAGVNELQHALPNLTISH